MAFQYYIRQLLNRVAAIVNNGQSMTLRMNSSQMIFLPIGTPVAVKIKARDGREAYVDLFLPPVIRRIKNILL
jgi:hypothetical protein